MYAALFIAALGGLLVPDGSPPMRVTQATHRDTSPSIGGLKAILPESFDRDDEAIAIAPNTPAAPAFDRVAQRFHLTRATASAVRSLAGTGEGLGGSILSPP